MKQMRTLLGIHFVHKRPPRRKRPFKITMSPGIVSPEPTFTVSPIDKSPKEKHNFGAIVTGLDLDTITGKELLVRRLECLLISNEDDDVKALSDAIWTHKLVVVKGQKHIHPIKQWELVTRFDPKAPLVHSHGDIKTFNKQGGILSVSKPQEIVLE